MYSKKISFKSCCKLKNALGRKKKLNNLKIHFKFLFDMSSIMVSGGDWFMLEAL